jgi:hypothetical protein
MVLQVHGDEMHAHSEPSTAPHFVQGDKVTVITKNIFLRRQPNGKLRDRQLGPFTVEEHIGKRIYRLSVPTKVSLHPMFHVSNLRPCSTTFLWLAVLVTTSNDDDDELEVSQISTMCIKSLLRRRGRYLLFMTRLSDDSIPRFRHRLNEVHPTTTLQKFLETPQWHAFAETQVHIDFMHAFSARILESH